MALATVAQEAMSSPPKLVLCVIDAMAPAVLARARAQGATPTLSALIDRGRYVEECTAAFPSVTPVCAGSIITGAWQDHHGIPGMNWYQREEGRYVEYGSSLRAAQRFGIARQLTDTVYNLNQAHLAREVPTIFERLDDAGVRTACTTYLVYRGRHRHEPRRDGLLTRLAAPIMRHSVLGPRELFYADIFASGEAPCSAVLGMPGIRDRHSACVGAYLVERDLFDMLLLSLPDNDWYSHKHGPDAQVRSLAQADAHLARVMEAGGGLDRFLSEHAVIVMGDHAQAPISGAVDLFRELSELGVAPPRGPAQEAGIAVCPSQRAAMVYVLDAGAREHTRARILSLARHMAGVELACWMEHDAHERPLEAVIAGADGAELRFAPGGERHDARGAAWSIEGDLEVLGMEVRGESLVAREYPDALARVWAALACRSSGDVLLSAASDYEFADWGGQAHLRGGSHGSLRGEDSNTALIMCGLDPLGPDPATWTICDAAPLVLGHFGIGERARRTGRGAARSRRREGAASS
jgi:Type I phosphodiesterase / nucleotide pyrophosphatase